MSVAASDYVFLACVVLVTAASAGGGHGNGLARAINMAQAAALALLILLVMLRNGIFAVAVMSCTSALVSRMPMTFDSESVYATASWIALAMMLGLAVAGFRLPPPPPAAPRPSAPPTAPAA